jgi:hypothetical protein
VARLVERDRGTQEGVMDGRMKDSVRRTLDKFTISTLLEDKRAALVDLKVNHAMRL